MAGTECYCQSTMKPQNVTGQSTEQKVRRRLKAIGLEAAKPKRDVGVDISGEHSEMDLDIEYRGRPLTEIY